MMKMALMKIAFIATAAVAVLTTAPLTIPAKAQVSMFRSGGTVTVMMIVGGMTTQSASVQVVSPSARDTTVARSRQESNGTTVA